jgi:hypothetical protein
VFYAANGHLLEGIIREQMNEIRKHADVEIFTVYLQVWRPILARNCLNLALYPRLFARASHQVEKETLWSRISDRLKREPHRAKYHEVGVPVGSFPAAGVWVVRLSGNPSHVISPWFSLRTNAPGWNTP